MAQPLTSSALTTLLDRLPHEEENVETIALRIRITTDQGRTVFAFARAGEKPLSFTGLEARSGMTGEEDWDYFIFGALNPGDPLQVVNRDGPLGVVTSAELEDRGK
jgi:hypothetical protein